MGQKLSSSTCDPYYLYHYTAEDLPLPFSPDVIPEPLQRHFSAESMYMAHTIGLTPLLTAYHQSIDDQRIAPTLENRVTVLESQQRLFQKIHLLELEISAVSGALNCEQERAALVADYLLQLETAHVARLNVAAIVVAGSGAILTEAYFGSPAERNIGLATGILGTGIGVLMLTHKRKSSYFHSHNHLTDLVLGASTSLYFPPSVWYFLRTTQNQGDTIHSRSSAMLNRWLDFGKVQLSNGNALEQYKDLLTGSGGKYTGLELYQRASMYEQVDAQVRLMLQYIRKLSVEIQQLGLE